MSKLRVLECMCGTSFTVSVQASRAKYCPACSKLHRKMQEQKRKKLHTKTITEEDRLLGLVQNKESEVFLWRDISQPTFVDEKITTVLVRID